MADTYTVYELTATIRDLLDADWRLQDVWIEGEVSNFRRHTSGHLYFTLKDERSELACVMWRASAAYLNFEPQHGVSVLAHGRVSVYEARGQYQLVCDTLQPAGLGLLNQQFERLKAQLEQEGLFDSARKRPIPFFPRRIGIVTSATTAAFQDMQNVIRRRCPAVQLILSPTPVQGKDAPPQIIDALRRLNERDDIDVIILARGGGSLEDLWCFNDESLVRAVAASKIPVVTGVGHEIDFTLVDFAADYRAPTPSAAAELVTPDSIALRTSIRSLANKLNGEMVASLDNWRAGTEAESRLLARFSPQVQINNARQRIDDWTARMDSGMQHRLARRRDRVTAAGRALEAASPSALLRRGYAMITRSDGTRVSSVQQAAEGTTIYITLQDGKLTASVRERTVRERTQETE